MYPSTEELIAGSTVAELTGLEPAQQDALRDEAIIAVEGYCRQSFTAEGTEAEPVSVAVDGTGDGILYLPRRLAALTGLSVSTGTFGVGDVSLGPDHDRLSLSPDAAISTWASRAVAQAQGIQQPVFPAGPGRVEVTGIWGWADDEYPAALTTALRYAMEDQALAGAHKLADSVRSARALGLSSLSQGNLNLDLGKGEPVLSARARRVLSAPGLRWQRAGGAVA